MGQLGRFGRREPPFWNWLADQGLGGGDRFHVLGRAEMLEGQCVVNNRTLFQFFAGYRSKDCLIPICPEVFGWLTGGALPWLGFGKQVRCAKFGDKGQKDDRFQ